MRWIPFAILLYAVTALQSTVAPFVAVHGVRPDLLLIVAVHYALAARAHDALLACWIVGLACDLTSLSFHDWGNVGVGAFSYGLAGLMVVTLRELTFRDSVITQIVFTFAAKLLVGVLTGAHLLAVLNVWNRSGEVLLAAFYGAVYTATIAPYGHWLLRRARGLLGIGATHRLRVG